MTKSPWAARECSPRPRSTPARSGSPSPRRPREGSPGPPWTTSWRRSWPTRPFVHLPGNSWTTRAALDAETVVLAAVGHGSTVRSLPRAAVTRAIREATVPLDREQVAAVRLACGASRFVALAAPTGAGKGQVLAAVAAAHRGAGGRAVAVAVAGATAQRLGESTSADVACTLEAFVHRVGVGRLRLEREDVVLLDEAGVFETSRFAAFLEAADPGPGGGGRRPRPALPHRPRRHLASPHGRR